MRWGDTNNGTSFQIPFDEEDTLGALRRYVANGRIAARRTTTDFDIASQEQKRTNIFLGRNFEFLILQEIPWPRTREAES
jgi:hypothetical protein